MALEDARGSAAFASVDADPDPKLIDAESCRFRIKMTVDRYGLRR